MILFLTGVDAHEERRACREKVGRGIRRGVSPPRTTLTHRPRSLEWWGSEVKESSVCPYPYD